MRGNAKQALRERAKARKDAPGYAPLHYQAVVPGHLRQQVEVVIAEARYDTDRAEQIRQLVWTAYCTGHHDGEAKV